MTKSGYLDPRLSALLHSLRQRIRRYVVWDSLLAVAAVVLAAFWLGLLLDYLPVQLRGTEMPRLARGLLLAAAIGLVLVILFRMLVGRLARPLPDDSLALLVERHHPGLGGRLVTAVQLNEPGRTGDSHSPALLQEVHAQAAAAIDEVDPGRVFRREPLIRKAMVAVPLAVGAIGFLIISPQAFGRALSRLTLLSDEPWPRRAQLEMVGVELPVVSASDELTESPKLIKFKDKVVRLPQGSSGTLRIRAKAEGAELPVVCTVYYRTDAGTRGQSNMRRVGRIIDGFQSFVLDGPPLTGLSESLTFDVRGLDDRLDDFRVESVTPPALTETTVSVRYPDYLRTATGNDFDWSTSYQSGVRLREGSDVILTATSSVPLGESDVMVKTDSGQVTEVGIQYSEDRRSIALTLPDIWSATTINMVPSDVDGISAQAPYRYFLGVVQDEPPKLDMRLVGIGNAVTPIAKIPVEAIATDDYGIKDLVISITPSSDPEATGSEAVDAEAAASASLTPVLSRDGQARSELDLRDLVADRKLPVIATGGAVSVIGEASDRYDLGPAHLTRSEVFRLQVVTPEELLALMERRELGLRARLEQTIDETRSLRDSLDMFRRQGFAESAVETPVDEESLTRDQLVKRLRIQESGLRANKTSQELSGIAASLDDILLEMVNNRVDSLDRQERIGSGVRDPLKRIVDDPMRRLQDQIAALERAVGEPETATPAAAKAVETAEEVLLQLTAVLEKMLDLESYNEILDMVRELIDDQQRLMDDTKDERKKRVLDLFE